MQCSGRPDFDIEKEQLGFDHADVAVAMTKLWNFLELLTKSISGHHQNYSRENPEEQNIMILTGYLSDRLEFKDPKQMPLDNWKFDENGLMDGLKLNNAQFCTIMNNSYAEYLLAFEAFCGVQT